MASKNAALLLTELALDLRLSCWGAAAEPLVLQLMLERWRSVVFNKAEAALTALSEVELLLVSGAAPVTCNSADSST